MAKKELEIEIQKSNLIKEQKEQEDNEKFENNLKYDNCIDNVQINFDITRNQNCELIYEQEIKDYNACMKYWENSAILVPEEQCYNLKPKTKKESCSLPITIANTLNESLKYEKDRCFDLYWE